MFLSIQNQAPDDLREEVRKKGSVLTIRAFVPAHGVPHAERWLHRLFLLSQMARVQTARAAMLRVGGGMDLLPSGVPGAGEIRDVRGGMDLSLLGRARSWGDRRYLVWEGGGAPFPSGVPRTT